MALRNLLPGILGVVTIVLSTGFRAQPAWETKTALLITLATVVAYLAGLLILNLSKGKVTGVARLVQLFLLAGLACLPLVFFLLPDAGGVKQLTALLIQMGLVAFLFFFNALFDNPKLTLSVNLVVIAIVLALNLGQLSKSSANKKPEFKAPAQAANLTQSSLYQLQVDRFDVVERDVEKIGYRLGGGAFDVIDDSRLLLIDDTGVFYLLTVVNGQVNSQKLDQIETNFDLAAYVAGSKSRFAKHFRITDMELEKTSDASLRSVFIAYHDWDTAQRCITLNVDEGQIDLNNPNQPVAWNTLFKSTPCLDIIGMSNETGGRLAVKDADSVLLSVGVTYTLGDTWERAADDSTSYGKIIEINRNSGASRIYSKGHRNPQGLLVDGDTIWSTEHGPAGGDELNLLVDGGDFGWPYSSYGTDYGKTTLKGSDTPGDHTGGIRPVYSWVPSIGVSNLIRVSGAKFPAWKGDLIVASLQGQETGYAMYRVRLRDDAVRVIERIETGLTIRDIVEMPDGTIVLWDGQKTVQVVSPAVDVFAQCTGCHGKGDGGETFAIGPTLQNVIDREVGTADLFNYSNAMKQAGGVWSVERLDSFLADPQKEVPGTTMVFDGIDDAATRKEIIEKLRELGQ